MKQTQTHFVQHVGVSLSAHLEPENQRSHGAVLAACTQSGDFREQWIK